MQKLSLYAKWRQSLLNRLEFAYHPTFCRAGRKRFKYFINKVNLHRYASQNRNI